MKETLKDKFNTIKTNVKDAFDKTTADRSKINRDALKDKGLTGSSGSVKSDFNKANKI